MLKYLTNQIYIFQIYITKDLCNITPKHSSYDSYFWTSLYIPITGPPLVQDWALWVGRSLILMSSVKQQCFLCTLYYRLASRVPLNTTQKMKQARATWKVVDVVYHDLLFCKGGRGDANCENNVLPSRGLIFVQEKSLAISCSALSIDQASVLNKIRHEDEWGTGLIPGFFHVDQESIFGRCTFRCRQQRLVVPRGYICIIVGSIIRVSGRLLSVLTPTVVEHREALPFKVA